MQLCLAVFFSLYHDRIIKFGRDPQANFLFRAGVFEQIDPVEPENAQSRSETLHGRKLHSLSDQQKQLQFLMHFVLQTPNHFFQFLTGKSEKENSAPSGSLEVLNRGKLSQCFLFSDIVNFRFFH